MGKTDNPSGYKLKETEKTVYLKNDTEVIGVQKKYIDVLKINMKDFYKVEDKMAKGDGSEVPPYKVFAQGPSASTTALAAAQKEDTTDLARSKASKDSPKNAALKNLPSTSKVFLDGKTINFGYEPKHTRVSLGMPEDNSAKNKEPLRSPSISPCKGEAMKVPVPPKSLSISPRKVNSDKDSFFPEKVDSETVPVPSDSPHIPTRKVDSEDVVVPLKAPPMLPRMINSESVPSRSDIPHILPRKVGSESAPVLSDCTPIISRKNKSKQGIVPSAPPTIRIQTSTSGNSSGLSDRSPIQSESSDSALILFRRDNSKKVLGPSDVPPVHPRRVNAAKDLDRSNSPAIVPRKVSSENNPASKNSILPTKVNSKKVLDHSDLPPIHSRRVCSEKVPAPSDYSTIDTRSVSSDMSTVFSVSASIPGEVNSTKELSSDDDSSISDFSPIIFRKLNSMEVVEPLNSPPILPRQKNNSENNPVPLAFHQDSSPTTHRKFNSGKTLACSDSSPILPRKDNSYTAQVPELSSPTAPGMAASEKNLITAVPQSSPSTSTAGRLDSTSAKDLGKYNSEETEEEDADSAKEDDAPKEDTSKSNVLWKESFGEILLKNLEDSAMKIMEPHESLEESCNKFDPIQFENAANGTDPKPDSKDGEINQTSTRVSSQGENEKPRMRRSKKKKAYRKCLSNEQPGPDPQILLAQTETGELKLVDVVDFTPPSSNVSSSETLKEVKVGSAQKPKKEEKEEGQNPKEERDNELISHILRLRERYEQGIDREKIARVILKPHSEPFISQELADKIFMRFFYFSIFFFLFLFVCPIFDSPPLIEVFLKAVMRFIVENCKRDI
ncbi:uncharacterized protein Dana_GF19088, isoform C [Drosophila ananassae]|uniref:Uncharacterized protein, isoform C n=1 Tax=Drosophila ananassae TaxID=7217 RepID=B3MZP5_DROAN|nr:uncharacterized protein LOC6501851 isoform X3 [Drosophila ananassae]EDV33846.2 uncharacterized protein Dana_GF19088, isoform C [Drosophila ananassae]